MTTGEMIRDLLNEKGKTQAELARFLTNATGKEVSTNTVNRWIPNDSNPDKKVYPPSAKYLPLIAEFLKVSVDILLGDAGAYGSDEHKRYIRMKRDKWGAFENLLQAFGYEIENDMYHEETNTIEVPTEYILKWGDEVRYIKAVDLDGFLRRLEKHMRVEIEDYI